MVPWAQILHLHEGGSDAILCVSGTGRKKETWQVPNGSLFGSIILMISESSKGLLPTLLASSTLLSQLQGHPMALLLKEMTECPKWECSCFWSTVTTALMFPTEADGWFEFELNLGSRYQKERWHLLRAHFATGIHMATSSAVSRGFPALIISKKK